MSNIAIYLARELTLGDFVIFTVFIIAFLQYLCQHRGEKIQEVVDRKTRVNNVVEATMIDSIYAFVLFYFKIKSKIPMSTTWVFLGLMSGREFGMSIEKLGGEDKDWKNAIKLSVLDIILAGTGFLASFGMA